MPRGYRRTLTITFYSCDKMNTLDQNDKFISGRRASTSEYQETTETVAVNSIEIEVAQGTPNVRYISFLQYNSNGGNTCKNVNTAFCEMVEPYKHHLTRLFFIKV